MVDVEIITLEEALQWLNIEEDDVYNAKKVPSIIEMINVYLENAVDFKIDEFGKINEKQKKILKIPFIALLCDMYENRSLEVSNNSKTRAIVESALLQASYCGFGE